MCKNFGGACEDGHFDGILEGLGGNEKVPQRHSLLPFSGSLAQLVEQRTFNPFVVGSTPARPTKSTLKSPRSPRSGAFLLAVAEGVVNQPAR